MKGLLCNHLLTNKIISPSQHGFLSKKSTETQLLECVNDWTASLNRNDNTDIFYIDIAKAFDVVSHPKLLSKLAKYGISPKFLNWIKAFESQKIDLITVYRSPETPAETDDLFVNDMTAYSFNRDLIVLGDFNLPHLFRRNPDRTSLALRALMVGSGTFS